MVNIPLQTMDDYGILEPTDVGNMTIDYTSKEEKLRRIRWDHDEVLCMLNLIKENKFVTRYSANKMANFLSQLMAKKGWNRTHRQIHMKITTLRKNYLAYERFKLADSTLKECPFYKELRDIYRDATSYANGIDMDDFDTNSQEELLIKFPSDPIDWSKEEVQKMLNLIKSMKLKNELTLTFFSPVAVRMIAEAMHQAGYDRSTEQVKNALINLRAMYIDYKIGFDQNENPSECMFYPCLDGFWGREYKKCRLKDKKKTKIDEFWSTDETIILLTLIQDLNITDGAYENSEKAAESLSRSLAENGYSRSKQQIMDRLEQLKMEFLSVHKKCAQADALKRFPFYYLYKKLFERQFTQEDINKSINSDKSQNDSLEYDEFCEKIDNTSQKKDTEWLKEEVRLLLKTIQTLTSTSHFNDCLEDEKLKKLRKILSDAGYYKTAEQIKNKLAQLKNSYLKCNLEDSSEKDVIECPFYNELHNIFQTPISDERFEFIQNLLAENMDSNSSKFSDHSYNKFGNLSNDSQTNDKVTVIPNNNSWFPVESIIDEEIVTSPFECNDITISTNEQEQAVEKELLASFSNISNSKINKNTTIAPIPGVKDVIVENNRVPSILNDVAIDRDIKTSSPEKDTNFSKIYKYNEDPDTGLQVNAAKRQAVVLSSDEDGQPPRKMPRIIEDEKVTKNKILLRPVGMNPSALNITNSKFVRLIVANDQPNKNRTNQIAAHIEPLNINTASSVSSGMSSPIERADILKLAAEKALLKDDFETHNDLKRDFQCNGSDTYYTKVSNCESTVSEAIKNAVQSMMKHDELLQQKHHAWMENQFELQRKHDEEQKNILMNELKELRSVVTVLLSNKQQPESNQNR